MEAHQMFVSLITSEISDLTIRCLALSPNQFEVYNVIYHSTATAPSRWWYSCQWRLFPCLLVNMNLNCHYGNMLCGAADVKHSKTIL